MKKLFTLVFLLSFFAGASFAADAHKVGPLEVLTTDAISSSDYVEEFHKLVELYPDIIYVNSQPLSKIKAKEFVEIVQNYSFTYADDGILMTVWVIEGNDLVFYIFPTPFLLSIIDLDCKLDGLINFLH